MARRRRRSTTKAGRAKRSTRHPEDRKTGKAGIPRSTSIQSVMLVVGAVIMLASMAIPWGTMDVETKLGIIPVTLEADLYEYGVSYEADLTGAEDIVGDTGNMGQKISEDRIFLTGLGKFQETVGFVKGSSKYKNHTIEPYTLPHDYHAKVSIGTHASNIPWWPVGVPQDVEVVVKIIEEPVNISHVEIERVWIELHRQVDGRDQYKVVWESSPGDRLRKLGDSERYSTQVTANEDYGAFSVVGRAEISMIDEDGKSNQGKEIRSFSDNPKMIDLWTIPQEKTVRIGMMLAAAPLTMASGALLLASVYPALRRKRWAWKLAIAGAVLGVLSVIFFITGVTALIELTGYYDWFQWDPVGLGSALTGAIVAVAASALMFINRPEKAKKKRMKPTVRRKTKKKVVRGEAPGSKDDEGGREVEEDEDGAWMPFDDE